MMLTIASAIAFFPFGYVIFHRIKYPELRSYMRGELYSFCAVVCIFSAIIGWFLAIGYILYQVDASL